MLNGWQTLALNRRRAPCAILGTWAPPILIWNQPNVTQCAAGFVADLQRGTRVPLLLLYGVGAERFNLLVSFAFGRTQGSAERGLKATRLCPASAREAQCRPVVYRSSYHRQT